MTGFSPAPRKGLVAPLLVARVAGADSVGPASSYALAVALWPLTFAGWFTGDARVAALAASALRYTGYAFGGFGLGMAMYFAALGAGRMGAPVLSGFAGWAWRWGVAGCWPKWPAWALKATSSPWRWRWWPTA